jgi:hypothetical protein
MYSSPISIGITFRTLRLEGHIARTEEKRAKSKGWIRHIDNEGLSVMMIIKTCPKETG